MLTGTKKSMVSIFNNVVLPFLKPAEQRRLLAKLAVLSSSIHRSRTDPTKLTEDDVSDKRLGAARVAQMKLRNVDIQNILDEYAICNPMRQQRMGLNERTLRICPKWRKISSAEDAAYLYEVEGGLKERKAFLHAVDVLKRTVPASEREGDANKG